LQSPESIVIIDLEVSVSVEITIPPFLQHLAGGLKQAAVEGETVAECLEALVAQYPELRPRLFGRGGKLPGGLNIFVNGESAFPGELSRPVKPGDRIHIAYVMVGG
jgi:molybdopterin converting factor small subunit